MCLFIVECGNAVSVGIVLQKNRTEPSTEIWGQKPIETDRKHKIPHRNNTTFVTYLSNRCHYRTSIGDKPWHDVSGWLVVGRHEGRL